MPLFLFYLAFVQRCLRFCTSQLTRILSISRDYLANNITYSVHDKTHTVRFARVAGLLKDHMHVDVAISVNFTVLCSSEGFERL